MNTKSFARKDAERLMPLLRSIGREMRERTKAIDSLEQRLEALSDSRRVHGEEIASLESQLSNHRRELRRIESEVGQLGCNLDADHPLRILIPAEGGALAFEGPLDDTQYYRRTALDQRT
jgi:chromosome segregation ATPase